MTKRLKLLVLSALALVVALACTLSLYATPTPAPTATPLPTPTTPPTPTVPPTPTPTLAPPTNTPPAGPGVTPPPSGIISGSPSGPYAVILVEPGDVLNIRSGPGVGNPVIGTFPRMATNVMRTGASARVGDDLWVEVQRPGGGSGWVNARFLTEYVASSAFCPDPKVGTLLDRFETAILSSNGDLLSSLVSPAHGLDLRVWRYGTVANYNQAEARFVFTSTYQVNWGPAPGSGLDTVGSFSEVPLPKLLDVLSAAYERHCNDPLDLATFALEPWPAAYANVNFYNLYKPGSPGVELDWRAWLAGVEYIQGQPYLFALIHFQWEP